MARTSMYRIALQAEKYENRKINYKKPDNSPCENKWSQNFSAVFSAGTRPLRQVLRLTLSRPRQASTTGSAPALPRSLARDDSGRHPDPEPP